MAATEKSSRALWPKLLLLALLMGIGGMLFVELAVPAWDRRGTAKRHIIVRNLLQIDAVKQQWALDHGLTNAAQLDRTVTVADLAPYLLPAFTTNQFFGNPQYGELYLIRNLNQTPEAVLALPLQEVGGLPDVPRGTVIRLCPEAEGFHYELTRPDGTLQRF